MADTDKKINLRTETVREKESVMTILEGIANSESLQIHLTNELKLSCAEIEDLKDVLRRS